MSKTVSFKMTLYRKKIAIALTAKPKAATNNSKEKAIAFETKAKEKAIAIETLPILLNLK